MLELALLLDIQQDQAGSGKARMEKVVVLAFVILFVVGMGLHARFVWVIKQKYSELYKELDEPGLFHAKNFKAQGFMARQALSSDEKYDDLTTLCRVNFFVGILYLFVFIGLAVLMFK